MQARHLSSALLTLGVLVGVVAVVGLLVGFEPARLPAALLNVAAYKLTFLAAFGLLAAGAVVTRYSRRADERAGARAGLVSAAGGAPAAATPTRVAEAAEPRPGRPSAG
jgi:nitrate/nitrite transporter NarK